MSCCRICLVSGLLLFWLVSVAGNGGNEVTKYTSLDSMNVLIVVLNTFSKVIIYGFVPRETKQSFT